ncbi:Protein of unknown function [Pyronema omphalodes CBS 100304]|uniref:Uncharacterized protein n=1 Tax=Pyronema omphalodes (strain CBS 100304) TaxID=1076935 RepID=U4LJZ8_PYROM|nr:Protein of unknown function [Pyronema omphalodes CBS 100304]
MIHPSLNSLVRVEGRKGRTGSTLFYYATLRLRGLHRLTGLPGT